MCKHNKNNDSRFIDPCMRQVIMFLFFFFFGCVGGWIANEIYEEYNYYRQVDGLWIANANESEVDVIVEARDKHGDWICVNIRDMSFERALETCNHEVGHEIFAEVCEQDINKCLEISND